MTFYRYMLDNYQGKDNCKGDLANDMATYGKDFPHNYGKDYKEARKIIKRHLERHGACSDCLRVFSLCWTEYVRKETHYQREWSRRNKERVKQHREKSERRKALDQIADVETLEDGSVNFTDKQGRVFHVGPPADPNEPRFTTEGFKAIDRWLSNNTIRAGQKIVGAGFRRPDKSPWVILYTAGDLRPWCVQCNGNGHYFVLEEEARQFADQTRRYWFG